MKILIRRSSARGLYYYMKLPDPPHPDFEHFTTLLLSMSPTLMHHFTSTIPSLSSPHLYNVGSLRGQDCLPGSLRQVYQNNIVRQAGQLKACLCNRMVYF